MCYFLKKTPNILLISEILLSYLFLSSHNSILSVQMQKYKNYLIEVSHLIEYLQMEGKSIHQKQNVLPEEWLLSQCLFGKHLLSL